MLCFLNFVSSCWFFLITQKTRFLPNKVRIETFCKKLIFFALFGMELNKSAKNLKNEKKQNLIKCFKGALDKCYIIWLSPTFSKKKLGFLYH